MRQRILAKREDVEKTEQNRACPFDDSQKHSNLLTLKLVVDLEFVNAPHSVDPEFPGFVCELKSKKKGEGDVRICLSTQRKTRAIMPIQPIPR